MGTNKSLRILIVEDSADDVWLVKRVMKHAAIECEWLVVDDRERFTQALDVFQPDLVLSDHSLPCFNSIEAFEIFAYHRERNVRKPFILITGHVSEDFAVRMLKAGVDDFILKDRLKRLPFAIETALERCRLENERQKYLRQVIMKEALMKEAEHMAGLGSWQVDLKTGLNFWSDETYAIYGYDLGEVQPTYDVFISRVHPVDRALLEADLAGIMKTAQSWIREFRIIDAKGKLKYISGKIEVFRDGEGNPVRLVGFNLDITEKKRLEHELDLVYRTAKIGRWEFDVVGNNLWWSEVTREIHEVPSDYMPDVESAILFYQAGTSRHAITRTLEVARQTGNPWSEELQIVTARGHVRWVRATGQAEVINGRLVRLYGTLQDIHARKVAEEELKRSNQEKTAKLERIQNEFLVLDRDSKE